MTNITGSCNTCRDRFTDAKSIPCAVCCNNGLENRVSTWVPAPRIVRWMWKWLDRLADWVEEEE